VIFSGEIFAESLCGVCVCEYVMWKLSSVFSYDWYKNGEPLGNRFNVIYPSEGVLTIRPLSLLDEGYYQCYASNMYGTAVSPTTVLQRADIGSYPSSEPLEVTATEGSPYMIRCQPVKCFPEPSYSWAVVERGRLEEAPVRVVTDERVQIDDKGVF